MTEDGITIHPTGKKVVLEIEYDGDRVVLPLTLQQAHWFRDELQSAMSELEETHDPTEVTVDDE